MYLEKKIKINFLRQNKGFNGDVQNYEAINLLLMNGVINNVVFYFANY